MLFFVWCTKFGGYCWTKSEPVDITWNRSQFVHISFNDKWSRILPIKCGICYLRRCWKYLLLTSGVQLINAVSKLHPDCSTPRKRPFCAAPALAGPRSATCTEGKVEESPDQHYFCLKFQKKNWRTQGIFLFFLILPQHMFNSVDPQASPQRSVAPQAKHLESEASNFETSWRLMKDILKHQRYSNIRWI